MSPTVQLYWMRVILGIVAAAVTAVIAAYFFPMYEWSSLLNSITITLLIYFITYYIFRAIYRDKIEKQSKILSTGIGMYFFTWIAFFVLFYTAIIVILGLNF